MIALAERALAAPMLSAEQLAEYNETGHVLCRGFLDKSDVAALRPGILAAFERHRPEAKEITRPRTAYENAFIQVVNMGLSEPDVRALTRSPRLGQAAAMLMGTAGARIFIEDAMFKEPGRGHTPWHQDASCLPLEPRHMVTAWVPLVPVHADSGRLRFVRGSHRLGLLGPVDITEETDAYFSQRIERDGLTIDENPPMQPGDVSFHAGTTIHSALANHSTHMRELIAIHYFADGARISELDNPTRQNMAAHCAPQLCTGDLAVSDAWPLVYPNRSDPP